MRDSSMFIDVDWQTWADKIRSLLSCSSCRSADPNLVYIGCRHLLCGACFTNKVTKGRIGKSQCDVCGKRILKRYMKSSNTISSLVLYSQKMLKSIDSQLNKVPDDYGRIIDIDCLSQMVDKTKDPVGTTLIEDSVRIQSSPKKLHPEKMRIVRLNEKSCYNPSDLVLPEIGPTNISQHLTQEEIQLFKKITSGVDPQKLMMFLLCLQSVSPSKDMNETEMEVETNKVEPETSPFRGGNLSEFPSVLFASDAEDGDHHSIVVASQIVPSTPESSRRSSNTRLPTPFNTQELPAYSSVSNIDAAPELDYSKKLHNSIVSSEIQVSNENLAPPNVQNISNPIPDRSKKICIATSRLKKRIQNVVSMFCSRFEVILVSDIDPKETTHLLIQTDDFYKISRDAYTFKYLHAIANRIMVVSYLWAVESLSIGNMLESSHYLVFGDELYGEQNVPRTAIESTLGLFYNLTFVVIGKFENCVLTRSQMIELLRGSAAVVMETPADVNKLISEVTRFAVIMDEINEINQHLISLCHEHNIPLVSQDWVVESLVAWKLGKFECFSVK